MDPFSIFAIVSAVSTAVSAISSAIQNGEIDKANKLRSDLAKQYGADALKVVDEQIAKPDLQTATAGVGTPETRNNQMEALRLLADEYRTGGNTKADKDAMSLAQLNVGAQAASREAGLQDSLRARGMGGAGLAALTQNSQDAGNTLGKMSLENSANARQRALQALGQYASLGGQIRSSDFGEGMDRATHLDAVNQFNRNRSDRLMADKLAAMKAKMTGDASVADAQTASANNWANFGQNLAGGAQNMGSAYLDYEMSKKGKGR